MYIFQIAAINVKTSINSNESHGKVEIVGIRENAGCVGAKGWERHRGGGGLEEKVEERPGGDGMGGRVVDPLHHGHHTSYV